MREPYTVESCEAENGDHYCHEDVAAHIAALERENERLREALDVIARMDTGITTPDPLSAAPGVARTALTTSDQETSTE